MSSKYLWENFSVFYIELQKDIFDYVILDKRKL